MHCFKEYWAFIELPNLWAKHDSKGKWQSALNTGSVSTISSYHQLRVKYRIFVSTVMLWKSQISICSHDFPTGVFLVDAVASVKLAQTHHQYHQLVTQAGVRSDHSNTNTFREKNITWDCYKTLTVLLCCSDDSLQHHLWLSRLLVSEVTVFLWW